jgi:peroxiredoxin
MPTTIPTRAPILRVTPLVGEDELEVMLMVTPFVEDDVAAASPILLVKVLAKMLARVVLWAVAVIMVVYKEVITENSFVLMEGGGV